MRKLIYCGLEKYEQRYTAQLTNWCEETFKRRNIDYTIVTGETLTTEQQIVTGQVLDAHGRTYYSLSQIANLIKMMKEGKINKDDVIYFEDMYTSGLDSLFYIRDQIPEEYRPTIAVRCLAQSIDPDDFLHRWNMDRWMNYYEKMILSGGVILLASDEEMTAYARVAGWHRLCDKIYNISGLAFSSNEVRTHVNFVPWNSRKDIVSFAARFDREKQPHWYMDIAESDDSNTIYQVLQGGKLRSNDDTVITRARYLEAKGRLIIKDTLSKDQYYTELSNSKILFNCALQDWGGSNTLSEADALGVNIVFPAYKGFQEFLGPDPTRVYVPWIKQDAIDKINYNLKEPHPLMGKISDWASSTNDRILDILQGNGEQWNRSNNDYRKHVSERKW